HLPAPREHRHGRCRAHLPGIATPRPGGLCHAPVRRTAPCKRAAKCGERRAVPVALVTGGSRGIGRAIALRLARDGADVAFVWRRDAAAAADVEARIRALGRRCVPLQADLGDPAAVSAALDRLEAETDRVDVFVANAAATAFKPLLDVKPHHVEKTYAITIG